LRLHPERHPTSLDVLEFYPKLIDTAKPSEIDLVSISAFDPDDAIWPHNRCVDIICLNQTGMLNLDGETIHILYQKHILDSSSSLKAYAFLHALLKKSKHQLNDKMPTPLDIAEAISIG
jgi:hypothetical protein